jgi:hypothetical protein
LGVALSGLRMEVLGLGGLGGLLVELGLLAELIKQSLPCVIAQSTGYELRFEALFF